MATSKSIHTNTQKVILEGEIDLSAAAAVTATRGDQLACLKTGTGEYTFTYTGADGLRLYEVLFREANLSSTLQEYVARFKASSPSQAESPPDSPITFVVNTLKDSAGTYAATDVTATATLSVKLVFRNGPNPATAQL